MTRLSTTWNILCGFIVGVCLTLSSFHLFDSVTTKTMIYSEDIDVGVKTNFHRDNVNNSTNDPLPENKINHTWKVYMDLIPLISKLATEIKTAKQHVRGTKTSDALQRATNIVKRSLKLLNVNWHTVTERVLHKSESVCPEGHEGPKKVGQYYSLKGFYTKDCTYGKSMDDIVTIVVVREASQSYSIDRFVSSIRKVHPRITVLIATDSKPQASPDKNVQFFPLSDKLSLGKTWNKLIKFVKTKYVLVARDIMWFNKDVKLDRLVRQLERLKVSTVGGSTRNILGHWSIGCHQRAFRNFTLVFEDGYDVSIEECLFCDHLDGPFLMKSMDAKNEIFQEKITNQGLFEDFFLSKANKEHVVCPDAMFYVNRSERSYRSDDWKDFADIWKVQKMKFSEKVIDIPCRSDYSCYPIGKGGSLTPCCMKENADLLNHVLSICDRVGAICELDSGSMMGSVKLNGVLPWERDADTIFLSSNFSILKNSMSVLHKLGYSTTVEDSIKCCNTYKNTSRKSGGYFGVRSKHWRLEMWGYPYVDSEPINMDGFPATLIPMDGKWVRSTRNPGATVRQRYGREIFRHAQHWMDSGKTTSWINYETNTFIRCPVFNHQSCLDKYNGDGNLQFRDPIP